jgi:hypothetical protein
MSYRVYPIDLTQRQDRLTIVGPNQAIAHVVIVAQPDGAAFDLAWGAGGEWVPALGVGMSVDFEKCAPETDGLYVRIPAGQLGAAKIYVGFAGGAR